MYIWFCNTILNELDTSMGLLILASKPLAKKLSVLHGHTSFVA